MFSGLQKETRVKYKNVLAEFHKKVKISIPKKYAHERVKVKEVNEDALAGDEVNELIEN